MYKKTFLKDKFLTVCEDFISSKVKFCKKYPKSLIIDSLFAQFKSVLTEKHCNPLNSFKIVKTDHVYGIRRKFSQI